MTILIRDTETAICQVHFDGYVISEPSRARTSKAREALFVLNIGADVLYIYPEHEEAQRGPITAEYQYLAQQARECRFQILAALQEADAQAARREQGRLKNMGIRKTALISQRKV